MPFRSVCVVWYDRDRGSNDLPQVGVDRRALGGGWQAVAAEQQLVPDDRSDGDLVLMLLEPVEDLLVGGRTQRFGHNIRVEHKLQAHQITSRPGEESRTPSKVSGSIWSCARST